MGNIMRRTGGEQQAQADVEFERSFRGRPRHYVCLDSSLLVNRHLVVRWSRSPEAAALPWQDGGTDVDFLVALPCHAGGCWSKHPCALLCCALLLHWGPV
jgi:hypothetical protein